MKPRFKKVISASRRIDMIGHAPDQLIDVLKQKCPPETVHTLVIWTKNTRNLFEYQPLLEVVKQYDQLFFHYTVTGMGGTIFEPRVPSSDEAMNYLDRIVDLAGDPRRVRFRFDPIVHFLQSDGSTYCNLPWFEKLALRIRQSGVTNVSISWMSEYRKVLSRLSRNGIGVTRISLDLWRRECEIILEIADKNNLIIHGCCVPGMPGSRCIDGELLMALHPNQERCSLKKAKGQRTECGCTESWDIGWYHPCWHGCLYCYANPAELSFD